MTPTVAMLGMTRESFDAATMQFAAIRAHVKTQVDKDRIFTSTWVTLISFGITLPYVLAEGIHRRFKKTTQKAIASIRVFMFEENARLRAANIPLSWKLETYVAIPVQCEVTLTRTVL
jgi:hypothetical protein